MEKLRGIFARRKQEQESEDQLILREYVSVLERIEFSDETVDPTEATLIFERAGKSQEDVENDVKTLHNRRRYQETIERGEAAERELPDVEGQIEALNDKIRKLQEKQAPLFERRNELLQQAQAGGFARGHLRSNHGTVKL